MSACWVGVSGSGPARGTGVRDSPGDGQTAPGSLSALMTGLFPTEMGSLSRVFPDLSYLSKEVKGIPNNTAKIYSKITDAHPRKGFKRSLPDLRNKPAVYPSLTESLGFDCLDDETISDSSAIWREFY